MGKTWLAAFDACQFGDEVGRRPRVLIVAHRAHILAQAEAVLSRLPQGVKEQEVAETTEISS